MNALVESFAWCMAQVTLFAAATCAAYLLARRLRMSGLTTLLVASLSIIGILTTCALSPWPRWNLPVAKLAYATDGEPASTGGQTAQPTRNTHDHSHAIPIANYETNETVDNMVSELALLPVAEATSPLAIEFEATSTPPTNWPWRNIIVIVTGVASIVGLIRLAIGGLYLHTCRRHSAVISDDAICQLFDEVRNSLQIKHPVELRESARLAVAATFGWRRPLVLLPPAWRSWTPDQQRTVLAHELAHVRQRHFPAWIVGQLAVAAHFYHPLVHWLSTRLRLELELAADRLAETAFADRRQYAAALAGLALGISRPPRLITPLGLFMSRPLLMRRIAMLRQTNEAVPARSKTKCVVMLLIILLAGFGVAGLRASGSAELGQTPPVGGETPAVLPAPTDPAQTMRIVALLRVSRGEPMADKKEAADDAAWKVYCRSQVALLTSDWLLSMAVEPNEVTALPVVKSQPRPVAWLQQNFRVGFIADSEIMYVMMYCAPGDVAQVRHVVDAVVQKYMADVVDKDRQHQLNTIDTLKRNLAKLNKEIQHGTEEYIDLAKQLGSSAAEDDSRFSQQLTLKRLDRIESEILRLENEHAEAQRDVAVRFEARKRQIAEVRKRGARVGQPANVQTANDESDAKLAEEVMGDKRIEFEFRTARINQLNHQKETLENTIRRSGEKSVELSSQAEKIAQSKRIADELATKLQALELQLEGPSRITRVYPSAIATDAGAPPPVPARQSAPALR